MKDYVSFRLTAQKTTNSWEIGGASAVRDGEQKFISYRPGANSIWDEDNVKSIIKSQKIEFKYNDVASDPACEIIVPKTNKLLVDYLKTHPYFGVHYHIHDEEEVAQVKTENFDKIEKALTLIKGSSDNDIKAIALTILGNTAYGLTPLRCSALLKEKAIQTPDVVINAYESDDYETKHLSAHAFFSEIVKENVTQTSIVWNDASAGEILPMAQGENGIDKLATFLKEPSEKQRLVLQEIGARIQKKQLEQSLIDVKTIVKDTPETLKLLSEKDNEIAELRAMLAKPKEVVGDTNVGDKVAEAAQVSQESTKELTLEEAQKTYFVKFDKQVPPAQKNDLSWINKKLQE